MSETLSFYPNRNQFNFITANTGIDEFYDFLNNNNGTPFNIVATAGAGITFSAVPYLSGCQLNITSPAADRRIALTTSDNGFNTPVRPVMVGSYNGTSLQMRCKLDTVPIPADSVRIKFGFVTDFSVAMSTGVSAQTDIGWFFFYHSEYSPNWQCIGNYLSPSTNVIIDSGVPLTTADTYLAVVWTKTNCSFLINNTPVATANIPSTANFSAGQSMGVCLEQQANAGNTLNIDAIKFKTEFDTPRSFF